MRITTKGRYALRALLHLAHAEDDKPISIKTLAELEELSPEFLEQLFFRLKKAGIINSVRGPGGGFRLNRKPEEISMKDIFDAAGEEINISPCTFKTQAEHSECPKIIDCTMNSVWIEISAHFNAYFDNITLKYIKEKQR